MSVLQNFTTRSEGQGSPKPSKANMMIESFCFSVGLYNELDQGISKMRKCLLHKAFDLLRNSNLNIPTYAYRFELLVFGASLTSEG